MKEEERPRKRKSFSPLRVLIAVLVIISIFVVIVTWEEGNRMMDPLMGPVHSLTILPSAEKRRGMLSFDKDSPREVVVEAARRHGDSCTYWYFEEVYLGEEFVEGFLAAREGDIVPPGYPVVRKVFFVIESSRISRGFFRLLASTGLAGLEHLNIRLTNEGKADLEGLAGLVEYEGLLTIDVSNCPGSFEALYALSMGRSKRARPNLYLELYGREYTPEQAAQLNVIEGIDYYWH